MAEEAWYGTKKYNTWSRQQALKNYEEKKISLNMDKLALSKDKNKLKT